MFMVHFDKLRKNDFKSIISFKATTNLSQKEEVKFNMQYITARKCIATHKQLGKLVGALGKNDTFPTMSLYFYPPPQNSDSPSL